MAEQISSSHLPRLLLILSATTGLVDAVSVLGLGKVFTANMTGNIVFLGFAVAGAPGFSAPSFILALLAFSVGAVLAGRVGQSFSARPLRQWLIRAAVIEVVLLWLAAALAFGIDRHLQRPEWRVLIVIALTATAMGFRNATVRQFKVPDLTTTVLTLTLTGLAADSRLAGGQGQNVTRRLAAIFAMFIGAALGALLVLHFGLTPPLILAGVGVLTASLISIRHPAASSPHKV